MLNVYIGYDQREELAYNVAHYSMSVRAKGAIQITPLKLSRLESSGLMTRPLRRNRNQMFDVISNAPMSTEFANSRFLTPLLAQHGWALFTDCDVLCLTDLMELHKVADSRYAVMCVKHKNINESGTKMDGQVQTAYARKNWSSVMLFNCDHPANRRLTLEMVNTRPGRDLHRFCWLHDEEIGELPPEWNWLVNVQEKPAYPKIAHYTLGGPWFEHWESAEYDNMWLYEHARYLREFT